MSLARAELGARGCQGASRRLRPGRQERDIPQVDAATRQDEGRASTREPSAPAELPEGVRLIAPPCPVCGAQERRTLLTTPDLLFARPGRFGISRCASCGLVLSSPRPARDSLGFYYQGAYSGEGEEAMRKLQTEGLGALAQHARWGLLRLHRTLGPDDRLLDIGCGYGAFLRLMHQKTGCRIYGVDLDPGSIERSVCPPDATLVQGELHDAAFPDGHFQAITMLHSLEHVWNPTETLREVHRILAPGGTLLVEVPHFGGLLRRLFGKFWFPLLMPQHLVHLERRSLRGLLEAAGLRVKLLRACWAPAELSLSLGMVLRHTVGPRPRPGQPDPPPKLHQRIVGLLMILVFFFVDVPLSALLRFTGLAGHMVAVATRPGNGASGAPVVPSDPQRARPEGEAPSAQGPEEERS